MKRLDTIISMIQPGKRIADIGCDHAYISISAIKKGADFAYASDIRKGPLSRADENIKAEGLQDKIVTALADGLDGAEKYAPDTIVIAGMGGELIARIIHDAPFVYDKNIELILQPMTSQSELRSFLIKEGFEIQEERLSYEDRHIYQIFSCRYTKVRCEYTETELHVGKNHKESELCPVLYEKYIRKYKKIIDGMRLSGLSACDEEKIYKELSAKYENCRALSKTE